MPFKSEAQRKYLWANEPEIARDWTDIYGSRIQKAGGQLVQPGPGRPGYQGDRPPSVRGREHREATEREREGGGVSGVPDFVAMQAPTTYRSISPPKRDEHRGEGINQFLNRNVPGRQTTNEAMRNKFLTQYMLDDPSRRNKLIEMGLLGGDEEGWIGDITSLKSLEALKGLKYKGGYHDVNDPRHPDYDPRGGGEGEQPWLYPPTGIAATGTGSSTVCRFRFRKWTL